MPESRISISSREELDHAQKIRDITQEFRNRHEAGITGDVLDTASEGLTFKEILGRVEDRVQAERADGLDPRFNIRPILVVTALSILQDLGAVTVQSQPKRWSLTAIGREAALANK